MNTAPHSTPARRGATNRYLDALDALDVAGHLVEAIQMISASNADGKIIDTLASTVADHHARIRTILMEERP